MKRNMEESSEPYFELTCPDPRKSGGHVHYVKASKYRANTEKHTIAWKHRYKCTPCNATHSIGGKLKTSWVVRHMK